MCGVDGSVRVFSNVEDGATWSVALMGGSGRSAVTSAAYNYDGTLLGTTSTDCCARLYAVPSRQCIRIIALSSPAVAFCWHPHSPKEVPPLPNDGPDIIHVVFAAGGHCGRSGVCGG